MGQLAGELSGGLLGILPWRCPSTKLAAMRSLRCAQLAVTQIVAVPSRVFRSGVTRARFAPPAARLISALCAASALWACSEDLVDDTSPEICYSQKRWIGGVTGSEEMFPGGDCVGCHRIFDGPEFMAAGTVYGVFDPDGALTTRNECFGVEGALVTITAADGQVLQTRTNRAGNFYFEGREAALAAPFKVVVQYEQDNGDVSVQPMNSSPSYGGCARCHTPGATETEGALAGAILAREEIVEGAAPIFTGPVPPEP